MPMVYGKVSNDFGHLVKLRDRYVCIQGDTPCHGRRN